MLRALGALNANNGLNHLEEHHLDGDDREVMQALESLAAVDPGAANTLVTVMEKSGKHKNGGGAGMHNCHSGAVGLKNASVTFKVIRTITKGNGILLDGSGSPVNLPAPFYGVLENSSNYNRPINTFLPQDGSIHVKSFAKTADAKSLIVTYANADDSINETVQITGVNTVLTNLITALNSVEFVINKPKLIISDVLRTNQFDQPINIFIGSPFTSANQDSILPNDYKQEVLSDNTVRVLQDNICVSPEKTIVLMIVPPTIINANNANFAFSFVMPCSGFKKA